MTENFKILAQFVKDISCETPDVQSYIFVKENISKYAFFKISGWSENFMIVLTSIIPFFTAFELISIFNLYLEILSLTNMNVGVSGVSLDISLIKLPIIL